MKNGSKADPSSHPPGSPAGDAAPTLFDWPRQTGMWDTVLHAMDAKLVRRRRRRRQLRATAGIMLVFAVGLAWQMRTELVQDAAVPSSSAIVSVPVQRILPDGSVVELKEGAEIFVDYSSAFRRVVLRRGEAHFDVAKDPAREFVVQAGRVDVRAVGTAFVVGVGDTAIDVLVTEGRVAVARTAGAPAASSTATAPEVPTLVGAGYRLIVEPGTSRRVPAPVALSNAEIDERLTWRIPRLQFAGTSLTEALPMINRHSPVRLTLADAGLGSVRLSGMLRADNTEALLALLEVDHGIKAERRGENEIVLRKPSQ